MFRPDHFDWTCVNILLGDGDAYSTDVALAFEKAAKKVGIDVCTKASYNAGSVAVEDKRPMKAPIEKIMGNSCCLVTVLIAQTKDISSLLLEAHRQKYPGEWIMSENTLSSLDGIIADLKQHNMTDDSIQKLLRGLFEFTEIIEILRACKFKYSFCIL